MYSIKQILKGIRSPKLIQNELLFHINSFRSFDYAYNGAFITSNTNIGDRAIAKSFAHQVKQQGRTVKRFPTRIEKTRSKVHVIGGGSILRDCGASVDSKKISLLENRLNWVTQNERGAIIGAGVPGFKEEQSKKIAESKLSDVELITVRDEWSYNNIKKYCDTQVYLTACPVFLLNDPDMETHEYTGVNFRPWPNYSSEVMSYHFEFDNIDVDLAKEKYIENANRICDRIDDAKFIPFSDKDEDFAKDNLDLDVFPYVPSVEKTLQRVSQANNMVSTRYHSLIFSAITKTPVLPIAYQPKVSELAKRLDVPFYYPHDSNIQVAFEEPSNVNKLEKLARRNFDLLERV